MVGANAGLVGMAREHLSVAFALSVPVAVVVTKVDMCPAPVLEETMRQLQKVLRSPACRRAPVVVKSADEALLVSRQLVAQRLCPIFQVSNVTGEGIDRLKLFLNAVPTQSAKYSVNGPVEYEIVETFVVPGVGTVVSGTMISGHLSLGQSVFLGPDGNGQFTQTQIKGIHRKRVVVTEAWAGQSVSFALKRIKRNAITKGMIILTADPNALLPSPTASPASPGSAGVVSRACMEFEAEVIILFHSTTMGPRYQAMLHCGVARQTVVIVAMGQDLLRTGDRALVRFRFLRHPEFLRVGARLVFREGRTKGVGRITRLF
jgi:GTPase